MIGQRRAIDVIHCHTIEGLGIALAFKALTFSRAPICMDVHGPVVPELVHYHLIPNWRPVVAAVEMLERVMLSFVRHAFVVDDSHLYWTSKDGVFRADKDGSAKTKLDDAEKLGPIAVDEKSLFYTSGDTVRVLPK